MSVEIDIQETYFLENAEQLRAIAEPVRWRMLTLLIAKPLTGAQLARLLKIPRARAHYHLKTLEKAGLIRRVEERQRQHMLEYYYRAIAVNYRTDRLLALDAQAAEAGDQAAEAAGVLPGLIRSMLALVDVDLANPAVQAHLARLNFNNQGDLLLTAGQFEQMRKEMRQVVEHFRELERQNAAHPNPAELFPFRFTLLLTPTGAIEVENGDDAHAHP